MDPAKPILLVEDNEDDAELTRRALSEARILNPVIVAGDGEVALDYLFGTGLHRDRNPSLQPVVVFLDLNLPMLTGLDVLKRMREDDRTRRVPVVVLTTSNEPDDVSAALALHASSYVRKPVDFDAFREAARQIGLYWTVITEPVPRG